MDPLLHTALAAAEAAAQIHLRHFRRVGVGSAREKSPSDFVSRVDLEAQEAAVAVIRARFPGHGILAEEEGEETGSSTVAGAERSWPEDGTPLWIIDPLDGTTNFLHGHPMFAASVAVGRMVSAEEAATGTGLAGGAPSGSSAPAGVLPSATPTKRACGPSGVLLAGAVVAPRGGERWWAHRGGGAWKNGLRIRVSALPTLRPALVGTGFPFKEPPLVPRYLEQLGRVLPAAGGVRRGGSAALDLCYLAEGILDGFWEEAYLSPWDVAAGLLILQEAGGVARRIGEEPLALDDGSLLAANSAALLEELGRVVRGERKG
jgi:myo-inositol-1(or 4)-monophosphatase